MEDLPKKSLFFLTVDNPVRKVAINIVFSKWFDRFILSLIFFNCVFLAIDSKEPDFEDTIRGKMVAGSENVFLALFCWEMVVKIVGLGFAWDANSYLSDNWNRLDFVVVVLGIVAALDLGNFSAIRTVRVLRPLRTITGFSGMRKLVETLLKSIPLLMDVLVLAGESNVYARPIHSTPPTAMFNPPSLDAVSNLARQCLRVYITAPRVYENLHHVCT